MSAEDVEAFAAALSEFQAELPHVGKGQTANTGSYQYDYADLTDITEAAVPILTKHGFSWTAAPTLTDRGFVLRYALLHKAGHREGGDYPLPDPAKSSPQQIGSALTYGRRYCLCAVTGLAPGGDDDDGQTAADARSRDAAAPAPVETDAVWFNDIQSRLDLAANATELEALNAEARKHYKDGLLSKADAERWKGLAANRATELGVPA